VTPFVDSLSYDFLDQGFNSTIIVLSSPSAVKDIMDKTGSLTAGRPRSLLQLTTDSLHMIMENASELTGAIPMQSESIYRHCQWCLAPRTKVFSDGPHS
jgi:hypothetical protein